MDRKERLVVFTGAGMSAESGLKTFRDNGGLWENHKVEEVATPFAWENNPELVLRFYNERRKQLLKAEPNQGHYIIAALEKDFEIIIITQNIDDLHERAGSKNVLHLHGELRKARSTLNPNRVYPIEGPELKWGDTCEYGKQLRPYVVWFGEEVPAYQEAIEPIQNADRLIVIGSSLQVYPAAGLIHYAAPHCKKVLIDPRANEMQLDSAWTLINSSAEDGMEILYKNWSKKKAE